MLDHYKILIDKADYDLVKRSTWKIDSTGYAKATIHRKKCYMHRLILEAKPHVGTDHINGNKIDNRRANLRPCNKHENAANMKKRDGCSSKYKGVVYDKQSHAYKAEIESYHKLHHLGRFDNEVDAAIAYNKAAPFYFGEFAKLNNVSA